MTDGTEQASARSAQSGDWFERYGATQGSTNVVTRHVETGALLKFARATGETDPAYTNPEAGNGRLMASPTFLGTLSDAVAGVFLQPAEHDMFLHSADEVVNFEPIFAGDTITGTAELISANEKAGRHGMALVQTALVTLTNQHGRTVAELQVELRSFSTGSGAGSGAGAGAGAGKHADD